MRVLGIDPGLATVGLGLIESESGRDFTAIDWLTLTTPAKVPMNERLLEIDRDLTTFVRESKPDLAVIERLFFSVNEKTALDVAQARGVILCVLAREGIPCLDAGPMELKAAITGDGRADKIQMQNMVTRLLRLNETPQPDDAADGLALALYGAMHGDALMRVR